ncbi:MAG: class I SAM-dependent methyltransferase [Gammaproteobacteria bacterium]
MPLAASRPALPEPDEEAWTLHVQLLEYIRRAIEAAPGSIAFERYMDLALYAPGLGYYSAGLAKFGTAGDFVTAPEVSSLFAGCLARQCHEILGYLQDGVILELGAGTGRLAAELLVELERLGRLPREYLILEPSADLRERQQAQLGTTLAGMASRVRWLDSLPETPITGIVLANEVLDAMPVARFRRDHRGVREQRVGWGPTGPIWAHDMPAPLRLSEAVAALENGLGSALAVGYASEVNLMLRSWLAAISRCLLAGVLLAIDYGYTRREYYHPERRNGTLICHYRHRAHDDPLILAGLQDLSSFVDFTALAEHAAACDLQLGGYTTQAHFLMNCGLDQVLAEHGTRYTERYMRYAQQAQRLVMPGEMGERYKAMALCKGLPKYENTGHALLGFRSYEQRHRL